MFLVVNAEAILRFIVLCLSKFVLRLGVAVTIMDVKHCVGNIVATLTARKCSANYLATKHILEGSKIQVWKASSYLCIYLDPEL